MSEVEDAVRAEIKAMDGLRSGTSSSGLASAALALARELDADGNSATSKSNCARTLAEIFDRLYASLPEPETNDGLDELNERRAKRRASSG
jgi:hypothetical protein